MPWNVRKFVHNQLGEVNLSSDLGRVDPWARSDWSHTDIPRLRAGLVGAQVCNVKNQNFPILPVTYQKFFALITLSICNRPSPIFHKSRSENSNRVLIKACSITKDNVQCTILFKETIVDSI